MNIKRWTYPNPLTSEQIAQAESLTAAINVNPFLGRLLVQRGITNFEEAKDFFRPSLSHLHDPFLMKDMDKAVTRLLQAFQNQEKIIVYGDYDVDGATSVALFYGYLKQFYPHLEYYIPDRYSEGYGVSWQGIEYAQKNGFTLIVTLDCGIKSADKVAVAREKGIDFIICDHHRPDLNLPAAVAVLDPKREDCPYPYKELTGCGVGFKLLQGLCQQGFADETVLESYLDLLVVSIAADIVHITGENRVLATFGLKKINQRQRIGLNALIDIAGFKNELDITNIVFGLAPRINAAGRIAHAKEAVRLLLSNDKEQADAFAQEINQHNSDRRNFDTSITDEALNMIRENHWLLEAKSTVLYKEDWHKGVVGIVASRCIEHFHRPTIILTHSNGKAAGSARSVPGFDVYEAIEACSDLLEQFGGHTFAAGLSLPVDNVEAFRIKFDQIVRERILPEQLTPLVEIDMELDLNIINPRFYGILKQMAPFGPGNMTPVFASHDVRMSGNPTLMKEKHLKLEVFQPTPQGAVKFTAVGFGMADFYPKLVSGKPFSIAYTIEENTFRDKTTLQLYLKDIKFEA
ncbi:single-stranded-DNA-specific exonuclease RecJ [Runella sp. MFBS21]|uniref:single-stranded-DNA-specific exonuclease RecJ n=1 Tax=Runella sp. MFBS21 TaxID=3034018 RepID=UPI0023F854C7|nr:single-stranded-DNA-specific exonuclease RecJ [Runella sp. MFBS21]MDF7817577.1 single-stranded-DNA-specific exonuclease RecJ [Runella sp. MFBS21]